MIFKPKIKSIFPFAKARASAYEKTDDYRSCCNTTHQPATDDTIASPKPREHSVEGTRSLITTTLPPTDYCRSAVSFPQQEFPDGNLLQRNTINQLIEATSLEKTIVNQLIEATSLEKTIVNQLIEANSLEKTIVNQLIEANSLGKTGINQLIEATLLEKTGINQLIEGTSLENTSINQLIEANSLEKTGINQLIEGNSFERIDGRSEF